MSRSFLNATSNSQLMQESDLTLQLSEASGTIIDKMQGWLEAGLAMLPNFVVAVLVIVAFVVLAKVLRRITGRVLSTTSDNAQVQQLLGTVVYVGIILAGLFVALGVLQLQKTVTSLLAGVGILGIALGFAFQDIASNFVSGVLLAFRRPFKEGDIIESNGITGVVQRLELRSTLLKKFDGQLVYVPNKDIFTNPIVNIYGSGARRVEVSVGVSYSDDLELVKDTAISAVSEVSSLDTDRPVQFYYTEFGGSSINFIVRFWLSYEGQSPDFLEAQSEAIMRIKSAFDDAGVSIPFPIRTLDLGDNLKPFKEVFAAEAASRLN